MCFDQNTFNIFEDISNKNFLNIVHKSSDSFVLILIIMFFYYNNVKFCKFNISNIFTYVLFSSVVLILNQILKNLEINYLINSLIVIFFFLFCLLYFRISNTNVSN